MKTFMVRELSRKTAGVLATCDAEGGVVIQYQDGRQYDLLPRGKRCVAKTELPDFSARQKAVFSGRIFTARQLNAAVEAGKGEY